MKVFLSWSGKRSKAVAEALKEWLPLVINSVQPFISADIEKGAQGRSEIHTQLSDCKFGIVVVTPGNKDRPWLNYEAGALAKTVEGEPGRAATLLVGMTNQNDLTGPLADFQWTILTDRADMLKLVQTIAGIATPTRPAAEVEKAFNLMYESFWSELEPKLTATTPAAQTRGRTVDEKIDELLTMTREFTTSVIPDMIYSNMELVNKVNVLNLNLGGRRPIRLREDQDVVRKRQLTIEQRIKKTIEANVSSEYHGAFSVATNTVADSSTDIWVFYNADLVPNEVLFKLDAQINEVFDGIAIDFTPSPF